MRVCGVRCASSRALAHESLFIGWSSSCRRRRGRCRWRRREWRVPRQQQQQQQQPLIHTCRTMMPCADEGACSCDAAAAAAVAAVDDDAHRARECMLSEANSVAEQLWAPSCARFCTENACACSKCHRRADDFSLHCSLCRQYNEKRLVIKSTQKVVNRVTCS